MVEAGPRDKSPTLMRARRLAAIGLFLAAFVFATGNQAAAEDGVDTPAVDDVVEFSDPEPMIAGPKKRGKKRKGKRRKGPGKKNAKGQDKNTPKQGNKNANQHGGSPDHKPGGDKPGKKPEGNKPGKKPEGDKPVQTNTADDRPNPNRAPNSDRNRRRLVCIGGRVRAGRCLCRRAHRRTEMGASVVACRTAGQTRVLPQVSSAPQPEPNAAGPAADAPASVTPAASAEFVPNEVLVTVPAGTDETAEQALAQDLGAQIVGRHSVDLAGVRILRLRVPPGRTVAQVVSEAAADGRTNAAQPNYLYRPTASNTESEPFELQYALSKIELEGAHRVARGRGARVAIIDSGIDDKHPDLSGAVVDSIDVTGDSDATAGDHGTAMAGIIRARGMVQGIAPEAQLLGVRAVSSSGTATTLGILRGMDWAAGKGARIVNMSLAGPYDPLMERGVAAAYARDMILVAAAGNDGSDAEPAYPAAYDQVIAVTATDIQDGLYAQANQGDYIALSAPGVDVLVLALNHAHQMGSGTSYAAAHVSGVLALMLGQRPSLSARQAGQALMASARDLGPEGRDSQFGAGCTDASKALRLIGARPTVSTN